MIFGTLQVRIDRLIVRRRWLAGHWLGCSPTLQPMGVVRQLNVRGIFRGCSVPFRGLNTTPSISGSVGTQAKIFINAWALHAPPLSSLYHALLLQHTAFCHFLYFKMKFNNFVLAKLTNVKMGDKNLNGYLQDRSNTSMSSLNDRWDPQKTRNHQQRRFSMRIRTWSIGWGSWRKRKKNIQHLLHTHTHTETSPNPLMSNLMCLQLCYARYLNHGNA